LGEKRNFGGSPARLLGKRGGVWGGAQPLGVFFGGDKYSPPRFSRWGGGGKKKRMGRGGRFKIPGAHPGQFLWGGPPENFFPHGAPPAGFSKGPVFGGGERLPQGGGGGARLWEGFPFLRSFSPESAKKKTGAVIRKFCFFLNNSGGAFLGGFFFLGGRENPPFFFFLGFLARGLGGSALVCLGGRIGGFQSGIKKKIFFPQAPFFGPMGPFV